MHTAEMSSVNHRPLATSTVHRTPDNVPDEPTPTESDGQRIVLKEAPPRHTETIHEKRRTCSGQTVCKRMRSLVKAEVHIDLQELACVISEALLRELKSLFVQKNAEPDMLFTVETLAVRRTPSSRQKRAIIKIACYMDELK